MSGSTRCKGLVGQAGLRRVLQVQGHLRAGEAEAQTRAAVLQVAERLQDFSAAVEGPGNVLSGELEAGDIEAMVRALRRQGLLVADAELRARIELVKDCLEWRESNSQDLWIGVSRDLLIAS